MKQKQIWTLLVMLSLFTFTACGQPPAPTPAAGPATVVFTNEAFTGTPTAIIELVAPSPESTEPAQPTPTAVLPTPSPPATPEPTAPTSIQPLTITDPANALQVMTGAQLPVAGLVDPSTAVTVTLYIQVGPHRLSNDVVNVDVATGAWSATLPIPHSVSGLGRLTAATETETAVQDVQLVYDQQADNAGVSISVSRPGDGQFAVAGHPLFFEGSVTGAIDSTITIGLYTDNCTTFAARQSFTLTAVDATWNGMVNLPQTLNGRTCAFAYTGAPDQGFWREVQLWLPALHPDDETILGNITLGNARDTVFRAGESAYLFGSAIGAAGEELQLTWVGADGETLIAEGTAVVDSLGYWEVDLLLPTEAAGRTILTLQLGEGEDATFLRHELIIES